MNIYSYSRLRCFEQCPRKYKLQYIDKIRSDVKETVELFLGRRVHETLRKLYYDIQHQRKTMLEELVDYLHYLWRKKWHEEILIARKKYDQEDYLQIAEKCISNYYNHYKPFNHGRTVALEKRILTNLKGSSGYKLCGYIDRVTKTNDGCYEIHDYKTTSRLPTSSSIQNDWQLALYALILKLRYPYIRKIQLIWHFLKFNKEFCLTWTGQDLEESKKNTIQLIDVIEDSKEFPAKPSRLCDWCKFKTLCEHSYKIIS